MKFIVYNGFYFRPEAVAMVSEHQGNEKECCFVHLFSGEKIFFSHPAKKVVDVIADIANGEIEADDNPDVVNEQMDWHEMG